MDLFVVHELTGARDLMDAAIAAIAGAPEGASPDAEEHLEEADGALARACGAAGWSRFRVPSTDARRGSRARLTGLRLARVRVDRMIEEALRSRARSPVPTPAARPELGEALLDPG